MRPLFITRLTVGPIRQVASVAFDAYWRFAEDDGWALASHLALTALTSLFPFLIVVTALAGQFGSVQLSEAAAELLLDSWPSQVARPIAAEIHNVLTQSRGGLLTVSALFALYFASSGVEAVRIGLNRAYGVRERRPWWLTRAESISYVIVGAVALLALAFFVVLAPLAWTLAIRFFPAIQPIGALVTLVRFAVTALILTGALVLAHVMLPAERRSLRQVAPGVLFSVVLSIGFGVAFGSYLAEFATNYVTTYAGLASVMIALVFLYSLATIFVFGGELNAAILRARVEGRHSVKADLRAGALTPQFPRVHPRATSGRGR